MPNVTPATATNAASQRALPASLKQALADPFALGDEAEHLWRLPAVLPPVSDIALGISILGAQLAPVVRGHAAHCLGKLFVGFNERKTKGEADLALETWLEAVGDVPNDLWSSATIELLQAWSRDKHYGRMPEPADFRAVVAKQLRERETKLARARAMLKAHSAQVEESAEKPLATDVERIQHSIDVFTRLGMTSRAEGAKAKLARLRGQPGYGVVPRGDRGTDDRERGPFIPDNSPAARRCAELAVAHRTGKPAPDRDWESVPEAG